LVSGLSFWAASTLVLIVSVGAGSARASGVGSTTMR
jgi:hypothetical protein